MEVPKAVIAAIAIGSAALMLAICYIVGSVISELDSCFNNCESVVEVSVVNEVLFVTTVDLDVNYRNYASCDGGSTWTSAKEACGMHSLPTSTTGLRPTTKTICNPIIPSDCLRVDKLQGNLDESLDSGVTWKPVQIPISLRSASRCRNAQCPVTDIAFVSAGSTNNLVVAMVGAGIVIRTGDGKWFQRTVEEISTIH